MPIMPLPCMRGMKYQMPGVVIMGIRLPPNFVVLS